jgi:STE24 endopeptidase
MDRARLRLTATIVAAVVVAEGAVLIMRPREGVIEPAPVSARSYFSAAQIDRARDYRRPNLALYGASLAVETGLLVLLVARPPRALRRGMRRPVLAGAATGAALSVALTAATLPIAAVLHERAVDYGLSTQSWGAWAGDVGKSTAIGAVFAGGGAAIAVGLIRRFRRGWWLPGTAVVAVAGAAFLYAGPVVLDPIFNRFTPLPPGKTRTEVLTLARRAGVRVNQVFEVDASRRTTAANAYVTGLGSSKRVVLYDTLLERFTPQETRLVVAHELGHVHYADVPHGLLYLIVVAPLSLLAAARITERLGRGAAPGPSVIPALALSIGLVVFVQTAVSNQLSRDVEARADAFSLRLTHEPQPFVGFQRRIAITNLADPDPPRWTQALLGTHPTTVQRIGIAKAFSRSQSP